MKDCQWTFPLPKSGHFEPSFCGHLIPPLTSPLITLDHPLRERFWNAIRAGHSFALTTANLTEIWYGISLLPRAVQNQREWSEIRSSVAMYQIEEVDAIAAADL